MAVERSSETCFGRVVSSIEVPLASHTSSLPCPPLCQYRQDSYSARGLLNAAPRSAAVLSSLKLAPDRFLQRYSVVAAAGKLVSAVAAC